MCRYIPEFHVKKSRATIGITPNEKEDIADDTTHSKMTMENGEVNDPNPPNHAEQNELGASSDTSMTSILDATMYGNLPELKSLVKSGHSVNVQNEKGKTPLAIACYQGWYEGVVFLLENGSDQMIADHKQRLPLHAVTYNDKIRCLALLAQHLQPKMLNSADSERMTALHWAAYHDRPEHVQLLISKNVNILAIDCDGKTALHWASQKGNAMCVEILVREARGTNLVNFKDNTGKGAVHYAAAAGHSAALSSLTNSKICNIHIQDADDRQPLHWAAAFGRTECVAILLKLGADPNMHDVNTRNALFYAKQSSHKDCVSVLMAAMKQLYIEKKERTRADQNRQQVSLSARNRQVAPSQQEEEVAPSGSSSQLESATENSSQPPSSIPTKPSPTNSGNNSKHKLPPIRGTMSSVTKPTPESKPVSSRDEKGIAGGNENSSQGKEEISENGTEQYFSVKKEKPANTAMKFIPTTRLYHES